MTKQELIEAWERKASEERYLWGIIARIVLKTIKELPTEEAIKSLRAYYRKDRRHGCGTASGAYFKIAADELSKIAKAGGGCIEG